MSIMRLYLIRHPRPQVEPGICYGRTDLAVEPQQNALALAYLAPRLSRQVPLFCSPAVRCAGFASMLAGALDCTPPVLDARLAEMDFGAWEMRSWNDIPREEIDAWANDVVGYRPGGGETVLEAARRVRAFHDELKQCGQREAIVVCHAGTIRLLLACPRASTIADMAHEAAHAPGRIGYGELIVMDCGTLSALQ